MRRLLLGAALAAGGLALAPGAAGAATVDVAGLDDGGLFRFSPPDATAQPGDTVAWGFGQALAPHNVNLVAPGVDPADTAAHELLGIANPGATAPFTKVLDQAGTYLYYCSFHGGLAPGGMSGRIVVGAAGDPPPPPVDTGPAPAPNDSVFGGLLEEGDVAAPALTKVGALVAGRRLRVRYQLGEAATITVRVARGRRTVRTAVFKRRRAGVGTLALRARGLRPGRYTVTVTATDAAELTTAVSRKLVVRR